VSDFAHSTLIPKFESLFFNLFRKLEEIIIYIDNGSLLN